MPVANRPRAVRAAASNTAPAPGHEDWTSIEQSFVPDAERSTHERGSMPSGRLHWLPTFTPHLHGPAIADPAFFGAFRGATQKSDFSEPWLIGVRPQASGCAPHPMLQKTLRSPGSRARSVQACRGALTARSFSM